MTCLILRNSKILAGNPDALLILLAHLGSVGIASQSHNSEMAPGVTRTWFLTYPQCDLSRDAVLAHLQSIGTLEEYVVASELHQDGNPHLHAYAKYAAPGIRNAAAPTLFDVGGFHGNYQAARSPAKVIAYCVKEEDYISNINIPSLKAKKGKKVTAELVRTKTAAQAFSDGDVTFQALRAYQYARSIVLQPYTHTDVRGIWIWGPPGIGKSRAVREKYPDLYDKSQNKWFDGYEGQETILLDDFDDRKGCLGHYLKRWMDRYHCQGEIKGGNVQLRHHRFIVTSNYSIAECFGDDDVMATAVRRRCIVIHYERETDDIWSYVPGPFAPNFNIN